MSAVNTSNYIMSHGRHFLAYSARPQYPSKFVAALMGDITSKRVPFVPPTFIRDTIRARKRTTIANEAAIQPRDEELGLPLSQADTTATTTATHMVHREEHAENIDGASLDNIDANENVCVSNGGHSGATGGNECQSTWFGRLKANVNVRDITAGLQIFALVALIVLLIMTSNTVGSMNFKILSERNQDNLNEALSSITSMTGLIENVTGRVQTVAGDISDFSGNNVTQDNVQQVLTSAAKIVKSIGSVAGDVSNFAGNNVTQDNVQQVLTSAAKIVKSIGSVAGDVSDYTRKNATQDDFDDVVRKLGKLLDKGLDEFD